LKLKLVVSECLVSKGVPFKSITLSIFNCDTHNTSTMIEPISRFAKVIVPAIIIVSGVARHFADQKLIFERSLKVLVLRYYLKCIFKCSAAFQISYLEALD